MWHPVSDSSVGRFGRFCAQIHILTISMENVGLKSWKWYYNLDMQDKKDTGNGRPKSRNWGQEVGVYLRHRGFLYSFWQPLFNNQSACSAGDQSAIPGSGKSPGEGNGNPLQYSCLENPMDGGAWQATVHGVAKSRTWLNDFALL